MIEIFNRIDEIPSVLLKKWNELDIGLEQKPTWLKTLESLLSESERYYVFDREESEIKNFVIGTLVKELDCLNFILDVDVRDQIIKSREKDSAYFCYNVLFIGIPMSNYSGIIKTNNSDELRKDILNAFKKNKSVDAIFYTSLDQKSSSPDYDIIFPYFPNTRLNLLFKDFDEYLNSLKKKKRWDFKNKRKIFLDSKSYTKLIDNKNLNEEILESLYILYHATESKNEKNINYTAYSDEDKFKSFLLLDNKYKWLVAYNKDDIIIGFALLVFDGNTLLFKNVGLDYSCNDTVYTYFNLYYCAIEYALSASIEMMYCGTTTYDIKRRLGCELLFRNAALDILSLDNIANEELKRMSFSG